MKWKKEIISMLFLGLSTLVIIAYKIKITQKALIPNEMSLKSIFLNETFQNSPYPTKKVTKFQHTLINKSDEINHVKHFSTPNESETQYMLPLKKDVQNYFTGYAVISVATLKQNTLERYHYAFQVPLAILAWKRIGFETIVLISGTKEEWQQDNCLKVVLDYIKELHALCFFIDVDEHQRVMMSQVSRIFASTLLSSHLKETDYLIIGDADLWPLESVPYLLKPDKKILVLNSECCGSFTHKGHFYRMVPMANIGAKVGTWKQLITARNQSVPKTGKEIIVYLEKEFGDIVHKRVIKGENEAWFTDQRLISMLLSAWMHKYTITEIDFVPRNVGIDRIDRSWWSLKSFEGKIDIHTLDNVFKIGKWMRTLPVFRKMYGGNEHSALYSLCLIYFDDFDNALKKKNNVHFFN